MAKHTILFLAANPSDTHRLALDEEARAIHDMLERSRYRDFELVTRWATQPLDLLGELADQKPTVVHVSGHGAAEGLYLHQNDGRAALVPIDAIADAIATAGGSVRLVVLSACYSDARARALLAHVDCVVGMAGPVGDDAARRFAAGFYAALGARESLAAAVQRGRAAMKLASAEQPDAPRDVVQKAARDPAARRHGTEVQLRTRDGIDEGQYVVAVEFLIGRLTEYCEALVKWLDEPPPIVLEHTRKPLSEVYVPPRLRSHRTSASADGAAAGVEGEINAEALLRMVVAGGTFAVSSTSGSGKSMLVRWLAARIAHAALDALRAGRLPDRVPVVVKASTWRRKKGTEASLRRFKVGELIEARAEVRQWLFEHPRRVGLFIDGLDEIPGTIADQAADAIKAIAPETGSLIVTHRPQVTTPVDSRSFMLQPFNEAEQRDLSHNLDATLTPTMSHHQPDFVGNPLLLTYLCLLPEPERAPIRDATDLLEAVTAHLIRNRKLDDRQHTLQAIYEKIAWIQLSGGVDGEAVEKLRYDARLDTAELLAPGILTIEHQEYPDLQTIGFLHQSFAEYFAAGHVVQMLKASSDTPSLSDMIRTLGPDGVSYLLGRLARNPAYDVVLPGYARRTFYDLTVQQYMYDIGGLSSALEPLTAMFEGPKVSPLTVRLEAPDPSPHPSVRAAPKMSPRTEIVLRKLKAHALYGMGSAQVPAAIVALQELVAAVERYERTAAATEPTAWYRIWARDHAKNLDPSQPALDDLLPEALRRGDAPAPGDERLVIRAAHYWGHLGNQEVRGRVARGAPVKTALTAYVRAIAYRACALQFSFPAGDPIPGDAGDLADGRYLREARDILRDAGLPGWVSAYVPDDAVLADRHLERFPSLPQAIGDIANQLVWSGLVHCWDFIDSRDPAHVQRAMAKERVAGEMWRLATQAGSRPGVPRERIRYVLRLAELRTDIALVDRPAISELEVESRLDAALRGVGAEFDAAAIIDERGTRDMHGQVVALFRALAAPSAPPTHDAGRPAPTPVA